MTLLSVQRADDETVRAPSIAPAAVGRWTVATLIAFRFFFIYFGLYVLTTQMLGSLIVLPVGNVPELSRLPPLRNMTQWVAAHLFRVTRPLVITGSGSGDKTFDWVHAFCLLTLAIVATIAWSIADRRREHYATLHKWFTVFLRFAVAGTMVTYGAAKAVPLQMPAPGLTRLLEPFGQFSPMGVLWYSIGASRPYEMFTGSVELLAGVLLFVPRLATAGALIGLAAVTQVFALNMTYDVPVKLFSFHLIVMSLVLLAPEARRLADAFVLDRAVGPSTREPLARSRRAMRWLVAAQVAFGAYVIAMHVYGAAQGWRQFGGGAPKPVLYGIWNVDEMIVDGQVRPPLVTDVTRWRRVVVQSATSVSFQRMNDGFTVFPAKVDEATRTVTLTNAADKSPRARLVYERPSANTLILDGDMDGHKVRLTTRLVDHESFLLLNSPFRWVQEYPFNR
jgi:hypothetical protein